MGKNLSDKAMRPFGMRDKIAYAMGDIGCNMSFALNSYLMLFYTQYIGLSITTWGVIILLLKIWDAINDPIMGGLMDSIKP
ncbi:MAG: MFS transporter, partial [Clostridia bacterium]